MNNPSQGQSSPLTQARTQAQAPSYSTASRVAVSTPLVASAHTPAREAQNETDTHPPLLAHRGWMPTNVALCGARIMGIPAGEDYPHVCVVCEELAKRCRRA